MDSVRYLGNTYFFDIQKHDCYYYEIGDYTNVITYIATDYLGLEYKIEYRILGPRDILLSKRMVTKGVMPWDVIHLGRSKYFLEDNLEPIY
jgi:hypothetical protein